LEVLVLFCVVTPIFPIPSISFNLVERSSLYAKFQLLRLPGSGSYILTEGTGGQVFLLFWQTAFNWVESSSLHAKFQLPRLPESGSY
jgi:hypothetical protein